MDIIQTFAFLAKACLQRERWKERERLSPTLGANHVRESEFHPAAALCWQIYEAGWRRPSSQHQILCWAGVTSYLVLGAPRVARASQDRVAMRRVLRLAGSSVTAVVIG